MHRLVRVSPYKEAVSEVMFKDRNGKSLKGPGKSTLQRVGSNAKVQMSERFFLNSKV